MKINQFSLDNGLNVFIVPQKEATSVTVELMVRAGSQDEKKGTLGLAHFLEHMAFKGTQKWPSARKLAKILDQSGAVYNASTSKGVTTYWLKVAPEHLSLALEVITQMLNYALLEQKEIDIERGVIIEEMNMYQDQPRDQVGDFLENQLLGDNPLGRSIIGEKKDLLRVGRSDFVDFKKSWYLGSRMSLSVVGAIAEIQKVKKQIKKGFEGVNKGESEYLAIKGNPKKETLYWKKKKTEQTHFELGFLTVPTTSEKKWAGRVLSAVLGGGMSSRYWEIIREKRGWAYYVGAFQGLYSSTGYLAVKAGVKNEVAKQAMSLMKNELTKIKKDLKQEEVKRAKSMLSGRFLIAIEDAATVAHLLNRGWLFESKVNTPEKMLKKSKAVTHSQVKDFANEFINLKNLRGAVIGPLGK